MAATLAEAQTVITGCTSSGWKTYRGDRLRLVFHIATDGGSFNHEIITPHAAMPVNFARLPLVTATRIWNAALSADTEAGESLRARVVAASTAVPRGKTTDAQRADDVQQSAALAGMSLLPPARG